jgi:DNA-binding PadR family transcriptional regulator
MTSFAWGADAPMFSERDLRRLARYLRLAFGAPVEEPTAADRTRRATDTERDQRATDATDQDEERAERRNEPAQTWSCGPGARHRGPRPDYFDEATREAWRAHWRAWRMAMASGAAATEREDPWSRAEDPRADETRARASQGERGGPGKPRPRHGEGGETRSERGPRGPRRPGPEAGEPGGFGWGPGRPFAPFGPFGPGAGGSGRGFRGRGPGWRFEGGRGRAGRGDVRLGILALLSEGPRHGYQLIQDITERSDGAWAPSPGSIYPALSSLQDEGLIDDEKLEGRRVFSLTDAGRAYVADRQDQIDAVFAQNSPTSEHEALAEVGVLMWGVGEAALTVLGTGTEAQRAEARDLLARTRRDLFRILAEDTTPRTETGTSTDAEGEAEEPDQAVDDATTTGDSAQADDTAAPAEADAPEVDASAEPDETQQG